MRNKNRFVYGLLLTTTLIYSGASLSAGFVILRDKNQGICSLPVPAPGTNISYSFYPDATSPCKGFNDNARTIQVAEVPSATTIKLTNHHWCSSDTEGPWVHIKTIKKRTSTSIIQITNLFTYHPNQIIEPGLQLIMLLSTPDNLDKISCVRIITSAAPPTSSTTTP